MRTSHPSIIKVAGITLTIILLLGLFSLRAVQNTRHQDIPNTNFFFFWLAGRMELEGQNPYDQTQYLAGHQLYGATWIPNKIFPYPLPFAIFMIPLGLLSLPDAYKYWQIASQVIIASTIFLLLFHWKEPAQRRLFIPTTVSLLFFGPVYLTLLTGSIGAIALFFVLISFLLFEKDRPILAGVILSLTILKPPQGLTILLLAGVWFLARKDWKAILGIGLGGIALLLIGLIQDPQWVFKFYGATQVVMARTQGVDSNVWAFSYLVCKGTSPCSTILGGLGALALLGSGAWFLWRNNKRLSMWEALNIIIPIGFVSTLYLWSYDQILYIIPITWIIGKLVEKRKNYIQAFIFLSVLVISSLAALAQFSQTMKNSWSLGNTIIVLGMVFYLQYLEIRKPMAKLSNSMPTNSHKERAK